MKINDSGHTFCRLTLERVYEPSPRRVGPSSISLALAPNHIALIVVALLGILGAAGAGAAGMIPGLTAGIWPLR